MKVVSVKKYTPKTDDYILLFYANKATPLFSDVFENTAIPEESGGRRLVLHGEYNGIAGVTISAVRLDNANSTLEREIRIAVKKALDSLQDTGSKRLVVLLGDSPVEFAVAAQEGALLGGYSFNKYKKEQKKQEPTLVLQVQDLRATRRELTRTSSLFDWVNFSRDILNEPANVVHPESLSKIFLQKGRAAGMKMTLWNEARLKKEHCGGVLAVGSGASSRPCMVLGEYAPARAKKHLVLVGKGVTFDTGGYCLKPGGSQIGMKLDMGGAAMMFAASCAIAEAKLPVKITLLTPLVENDISRSSYHTEDILQMRNGMSVEVGNTDAEGRLILADALSIAAEKRPDYIIDAATLTGACMVGLGEDIAGLFATDSILSGQLLTAAEDAGEYMWELPLHQPYTKQLDSVVADTSNMGGKYGGSILAALFLQKFISNDASWAHIDIAGPGIKDDAHEHLGKGAKGFGVKTIFRFASSLS